MGRELNVLLVEDSEDDEIILSHELKKGGYDPTIERVETSKEMKDALKKREWDVVISDYSMPNFNGMDALKVLREKTSHIPFIILSGKIGENFAVDMLKSGANDYIMKGNMARLNPAIARELSEAQVRIEKEKASQDLVKSHAELASKSSELEESNQKLGIEVSERKRAEAEARAMRDYLEDVIDSATEVVITFDMSMRIGTWNKRVEQLTGYKKEEVLNRKVSKLPVFDSADRTTADVKDAGPKGSQSIELYLRTKSNAKKIISGYYSLIRNGEGKSQGVLFVGKDITSDIESHGKLLSGNSYLITGKTLKPAAELLLDLTRFGHEGLLITRYNKDSLRSIVPKSSNVRIMLLGQGKSQEYEIVEDLAGLAGAIKDFVSKNEEGVVLVDGTHYLLTRFSFQELTEMLYKLIDMISERKAILLVRVDPQLFNESQMAVLENELLMLPSQKVDDLIIEDESYDILKYIFEQNQDSSMVSFKKVMTKFKIAYLTAAKRLSDLEQKGLIYTKKYGKIKAVYISDKGKSLLQKRQLI